MASASKSGRRSKLSSYGVHLLEKQKLRTTYGLLERQFANTFHRAQRIRGVTGDIFLQMLERRLDNLVYRLNFAPSIFSARQLVRHGHVLVDGAKVDVPSFSVRPGQVISIREKSRRHPLLVGTLDRKGKGVPEYLEFRPEQFEGKLLVMPRAQDIPVKVDANLIVEFYSR